MRTVATDTPENRGKLIKMLEEAQELADQIGDGICGYLIERALDQVRAGLFRIPGWPASGIKS